MEQIKIEALPKEKWKGVPIPMVTRSDSCYDLEMSTLNKNGCTVALVRKPAEKEVAVRQNRRAVILETQSCNTNAIGFYLHEGFELIGFDTCCYTNNDIARREVRLDLGYFLHRDGRRF